MNSVRSNVEHEARYKRPIKRSEIRGAVGWYREVEAFGKVSISKGLLPTG